MPLSWITFFQRADSATLYVVAFLIQILQLRRNCDLIVLSVVQHRIKFGEIADTEREIHGQLRPLPNRLATLATRVAPVDGDAARPLLTIASDAFARLGGLAEIVAGNDNGSEAVKTSQFGDRQWTRKL